MNTYKRHRFRLGVPTRNHQLRCLALLSLQSQPPPVCRTIQINGKQHYLWRAVDQDGYVADVYLQARRDGVAAKRFSKRLVRSHGGEPRKMVSDKWRSYGVARREVIPEAIHVNDEYANNRVEQSYDPTGVGERGMRKFKARKITV